VGKELFRLNIRGMHLRMACEVIASMGPVLTREDPALRLHQVIFIATSRYMRRVHGSGNARTWLRFTYTQIDNLCRLLDKEAVEMISRRGIAF